MEVWEADPAEKVGALGDSGPPLSCQRAAMGGHLGVPDCSHEGPQRAVFGLPTSWPLLACQRCERKQQETRGKESSYDPSSLPHGTLRPVRVSHTVLGSDTTLGFSRQLRYILNWAGKFIRNYSDLKLSLRKVNGRSRREGWKEDKIMLYLHLINQAGIAEYL